VQGVRACARSLAILVCVDGLASYVTAFLRAFRHKIASGRRGRPRLVVEAGLLIGQLIKRYARRRVVGVVHRVVRGTSDGSSPKKLASKRQESPGSCGLGWVSGLAEVAM
jgi:hypothetical protein